MTTPGWHTQSECIVCEPHVSDCRILLVIETARLAERTGSTNRTYRRMLIAICALAHHHYRSALSDKVIYCHEQAVIRDIKRRHNQHGVLTEITHAFAVARYYISLNILHVKRLMSDMHGIIHIRGPDRMPMPLPSL